MTIQKDYTNLWGTISTCMCISVLVPISASLPTIPKMYNNL